MDSASNASKGMQGAGRPQWAIRSFVIWLVLVCLVPGLVGTAFLYYLQYRNGRAQLEKDTIATARALVQTVDSHLMRAQALAQALATAGALPRQDLEYFHRRASELIRLTGAGENFVLCDATGRQLVNTFRKFGDSLPRHGAPDLLRRVFETGQPQVSDIYLGGVTRKPVMSIDVPVIIDGRVVYDLSIGLMPQHFNDILVAQQLPPGWIAGVFDPTGTLAGRVPAPEQFVGQKGTAEFVRRIKEAPEGTMETVSREGIPTLSSWSRSSVTGWSVGIGIPRRELERDLMRSLLILGIGIGGGLAAGLALAWMAGRRVAHSFHALVDPALALGSGASMPIPSLDVKEAGEVAGAIEQAARLLEVRTAERRQAEMALAEARQYYRRHLEDQVAERTAELLEANRELERLSRKDVLTGLHNRLAANERLRLEFLRMKRTGATYSVLFLDIDHFKSINDRYGHETGDHILSRLAAILQAAMRESDLVARFGGEEFIVVLPDTDGPGAATIAEKIRLAVSQDTFPVVGPVTVSIGVAQALPQDKSEDEAVRRSDEALYEAKNAGRDRVCQHSLRG